MNTPSCSIRPADRLTLSGLDRISMRPQSSASKNPKNFTNSQKSTSMPTIFSHSEYDELVVETTKKVKELSTLKGGEYAGDEDRLANFRRNAQRIGLNMESIWHTYCAKHWDAVETYIKDLNTGNTRERMESLESRANDIIVYMILFKAILREKRP